MEIILQSNTKNLYSKGLVTSGSSGSPDRRRIDGNSHRPNIVPCIVPAFLRMRSPIRHRHRIRAETWQVRNVAVLQALSQAAQQSLQAGHLKGKGLAMIAKAFAELAPSQNVEMGRWGDGEGDGFQLPCFSFWFGFQGVVFNDLNFSCFGNSTIDCRYPSIRPTCPTFGRFQR